MAMSTLEEEAEEENVVGSGEWRLPSLPHPPPPCRSQHSSLLRRHIFCPWPHTLDAPFIPWPFTRTISRPRVPNMPSTTRCGVRGRSASPFASGIFYKPEDSSKAQHTLQHSGRLCLHRALGWRRSWCYAAPTDQATVNAFAVCLELRALQQWCAIFSRYVPSYSFFPSSSWHLLTVAQSTTAPASYTEMAGCLFLPQSCGWCQLLLLGGSRKATWIDDICYVAHSELSWDYAIQVSE